MKLGTNLLKLGGKTSKLGAKRITVEDQEKSNCEQNLKIGKKETDHRNKTFCI